MKNYNFRAIFQNFNENFAIFTKIFKNFSNFSRKFTDKSELCSSRGLRGLSPRMQEKSEPKRRHTMLTSNDESFAQEATSATLLHHFCLLWARCIHVALCWRPRFATFARQRTDAFRVFVHDYFTSCHANANSTCLTHTHFEKQTLYVQDKETGHTHSFEKDSIICLYEQFLR